MNEPRFFAVIGTDNQVFNFNTINETLHFKADRRLRHQAILSLIGGGEQLYSFVVDKHHPNGNEIHTIFSNGVIVIRNQESGRLITELIARKQQLRRYWDSMGKAYPIEVYAMLGNAERYERKGYNFM